MKTYKYASTYSILESMPSLNPMNWGLFGGRYWSFKVLSLLAMVLVLGAGNVWGQILWSSANGSGYFTPGNWTGSAVPTSSQIAQFGVNPTPGTSVGMNVNNATSQQVGAVEVTSSRLIALIIGHSGSSKNSFYQLNGTTVNSIANVIVRNNSGSLLTFANLAGGSTSTLGIVLGNATNNIINIDGTGGVTISSIISGANNLTKSGSGTGVLTLSGVNTYSGNTTISTGTLSLSGSGSIAASPIITIGTSATFNIASRTAALTLAAGQSLRSSATGSNASATVFVGNTATLTLSAGGLVFTAYGGGGTAPMGVGGPAGSLVLNSSPVTVTTTTALATGTYKLISKSGGATVTGTPGTLTMAGSGLAAGTTGALSVSSGELILTVSSSASSSSNIILNSGFTHPTNIDYAAYQSASGLTSSNAIEVGQFDIQDGGGSSDADALSTTLTACSLTVVNSANIRALALFDGSTNVGEITTVGSTAAFSGLTLAAADNGSKTFSVRATFKSAVTDNQQISFTVASATASGSGSSFAAANAGAAATTTTGDNNRIEVATTDVLFVQNVSAVAQNALMNPSPTVRAIDGNSNTDLDNTSNVVMTISTGLTTFDAAATTTVAMVSGVATFGNLILITAATTNNLTATQGAYTDISSSFDVTASAPEINIKQGATSLASGSGTYAAGSIVSGNSGSAITFTIENLGSANLTYSSITNSNTTDFTLDLTVTSTPIAASGNTTFTVTFNPTTTGSKSTTITINNNDADEGTYTFTVTGTGTVSSASDIITNSGYSYNSNIDYASFQTTSTLTTGNSVGVADFIIQDGAGVADADNLGTTLTAISFTTGGSTAIRTAALFDGVTNVAEVAVNGATTISFSGLTLSAADASTKNFELRVTYQSTVTDNQQITFTVSSATASATASGFAAANAGAAVSSATSDINRLEVTADRLAFVNQPNTTTINTALSPSVTVSANDGNGNRDLDYVTDMIATTTATFAVASTNTVTPTTGLGTFSNLQFLTAALTKTIAVTSGSLTNSGNSSTFNIYDAQPSTQASAITFTNVAMTSMTINWTNGSGANRMVVVKTAGAPGTPSDGQTYTANTILGSGSTFGASEYVVYNGSGNTVNITGLTASTSYSVKVFEYNGSVGTENYITTSNNTSQITSALTYYSNGSGDPAVLANWKTERAGTGSSPINFQSGEAFVIESGDVMTTTTTWLIGGVNSKLQIESGGTLTANHSVSLAFATTFQIDNGGNYIHGHTGGLSLILNGTEVFGTTSNFILNTTPSGWTTPLSPGYGNLTINTTTNATSVGLSGNLTQVQGNLTFTSTGTGAIRYALVNTTSTTLSVGGNLILNGATALLYLSSGAAGTASITVAGDLIVSAGILDLSNSGTGGAGVINIGGNFNQSGGIIKSTSSNASTINFTGSGKTFTQSGGTLTNTNINWSIADGASLTLVNDLPVATSRTLTVGSGTSGTLDCSTFAVSGAGAFTLASGATLKTAKTTGVFGSIAVSGTQTLSSASNYEFNGNSAQTLAALTLQNLTINNASGVTQTGTVTVNGILTLNAGVLDAANMLTLRDTGSIVHNGGTIINYTLPSDLKNYTPTTGTTTLSSNLTLSGSLNLGSNILDIGSNTLTVNGDITRTTGTIKTSLGTVILGGTTSSTLYLDQTTDGVTNKLKDLTINRTGATVTLGNKLQISDNGTVTVTAGTFAAGGNLVLTSTLSGTGRIAALTGGASVTGNVEIQRYMVGGASSQRGWRYMSTPVASATYAQLIDDIFITGPGGVTNGFDLSGSNSSIMYYEESTARGWKSLSSPNNTWTAGKGAIVFFRGDRTQTTSLTNTLIAPNSFALDYIGNINSGNYTVNLDYDNTVGIADNQGWNLIGNPYPSQIDWDNVSKTSGVNNFYYLINPNTKNYVSANTGIIAVSQGFFVQVNAASQSVTFEENDKTSSTGTAYFKTASNPLTIKMNVDSMQHDVAKMYFEINANKNYLFVEDAIKLKNSVYNLSIVTPNNFEVQNNYVPFLGSTGVDTFELKVTSATNSSYSLSFDNFNQIPTNKAIVLVDKLNNSITNLRVTPNYTFTINNSISASFNKRFLLIITDQLNTLPVKLIAFSGENQGKYNKLTWSSVAEKNLINYEVEKSIDGKTFESIGLIKATNNNTKTDYSFSDYAIGASDLNYYRLKINEQKGIVNYSQIIAIQNNSKFDAVLDVYPNPANHFININLPENDKLREVLFYDINGKLMMTSITAQNIEVSELNSGVYTIHVITDKSANRIKFIKQ
jgi:hypothetical protein